MNAEITWDLVMSGDMPFAEGCYRFQGGQWQVVTATKARPDHLPGVRNGVTWGSGVTGMNIVFPEHLKINRASLTQKMSEVFGVENGARSLGLIPWRCADDR